MENLEIGNSSADGPSPVEIQLTCEKCSEATESGDQNQKIGDVATIDNSDSKANAEDGQDPATSSVSKSYDQIADVKEASVHQALYTEAETSNENLEKIKQPETSKDQSKNEDNIQEQGTGEVDVSSAVVISDLPKPCTPATIIPSKPQNLVQRTCVVTAQCSVQNNCRPARAANCTGQQHQAASPTKKKWMLFGGNCFAISHMLSKKDPRSPWIIVYFLDALLRGYGQVLFCNNPVSGLLILFGLIIADPTVALVGFVCAAVGLALSFLIGQPASDVTAGLTTFNPLLVGLNTASLAPILFGIDLGPKLFIFIFVGVVFSVYLTSGLTSILRNVNLPSFAVPFILVQGLVFLALAHTTPITTSDEFSSNTTNISLLSPSNVHQAVAYSPRLQEELAENDSHEVQYLLDIQSEDQPNKREIEVFNGPLELIDALRRESMKDHSQEHGIPDHDGIEHPFEIIIRGDDNSVGQGLPFGHHHHMQFHPDHQGWHQVGQYPGHHAGHHFGHHNAHHRGHGHHIHHHQNGGGIQMEQPFHGPPIHVHHNDDLEIKHIILPEHTNILHENPTGHAHGHDGIHILPLHEVNHVLHESEIQSHPSAHLQHHEHFHNTEHHEGVEDSESTHETHKREHADHHHSHHKKRIHNEKHGDIGNGPHDPHAAHLQHDGDEEEEEEEDEEDQQEKHHHEKHHSGHNAGTHADNKDESEDVADEDEGEDYEDEEGSLTEQIHYHAHNRSYSLSIIEAPTKMSEKPGKIIWGKVFTGMLLSATQAFGVCDGPGSAFMFLGVLVSSPLTAFFLVLGCLIGTLAGLVLTAPPYVAVYEGVWGFNSMLASAGLAGFCFVLSWQSAALGLIAALFSAFLQSALTPLCDQVPMPIMSIPFNLTILLFLSVTTTRKSLVRPTEVSFPEKHLDDFRKAERGRGNNTRENPQEFRKEEATLVGKRAPLADQEIV